MSEEKNAKIREIANQFSNAIGQIDQEAERDFINELIEAVTVPLKKVPEPVFREIFLPYFTGEKKPTKENDAIAHWIGLVGSATDAAEVVNVKGEVLFRVPAIYDTECLNSSRPETVGMNFGTIFEIYQDQSRVHPNLGKSFLVEELSKKSVATIDDNKLSVKSSAWEPVLQYYHLLPEQQKAAAKQKETPGDDDLIFGDD